jgi:hypothetical protein
MQADNTRQLHPHELRDQVDAFITDATSADGETQYLHDHTIIALKTLMENLSKYKPPQEGKSAQSPGAKS